MAILAVILEHTWVFAPGGRLAQAVFFWDSFGWTGVELFFVLSGFLITGILYDSRGSVGYFRNFYVRRVLRIFPLYYGLLLIYFLVPRVFPLARGLGPAARAPWIYFAYLQNLDWGHVLTSAPPWLSVTWSLAVEEQFYLLWPFVIALVPLRRLLHVCVALAILALVWRLVALGVGVDPLARYHVLPSQVDALAVGSAIAIYARRPGGTDSLKRIALPMFGVPAVGLVAIGATANGVSFNYSDPLMETVGFSLIALAFGGLLTMALTSDASTLIHRLLVLRALRVAGKYSYSAYLLHYPVVLTVLAICMPVLLSVGAAIGSRLVPQVIFWALAIPGTFALAWITWQFVEGPALSLKRYFPYGHEKHRDAARLGSQGSLTVGPDR